MTALPAAACAPSAPTPTTSAPTTTTTAPTPTTSAPTTTTTRRTVFKRLAFVVTPAAALDVAAQWQLFTREPLLGAVNTTVGLSFLATAVLVSVELGQRRVALALAGAGVFWPLYGAGAWLAGPLPLLCTLQGPLPGVLAAWGLLHYPTPWANEKRERLLLVLFAAVQSLVFAVVLTARPDWHYFPPDTVWLPAWPNRQLFDILKIFYHGSHGLLAVCVAVAMPIRIRRLSGPDRHIMTPLALAVALAALATALSVPVELAGPAPPTKTPPARSRDTAECCSPASRPPSGGRTAAHPQPERGLRAGRPARLRHRRRRVLPALREALADPTLEILYWMPDTCCYIDADRRGSDGRPPTAARTGGRHPRRRRRTPRPGRRRPRAAAASPARRAGRPRAGPVAGQRPAARPDPRPDRPRPPNPANG